MPTRLPDGFLAVIRGTDGEQRVPLDGAHDLYAARLAARARDLCPVAIEQCLKGVVLRRVIG